MGYLYEIAYLADADLGFTAFAAACVPSLNSLSGLLPKYHFLLFFFVSFLFLSASSLGPCFPFCERAGGGDTRMSWEVAYCKYQRFSDEFIS